MTRYRYRAARPDGRILSGHLQAASASSAGALLLEQNLQPVALSEMPNLATLRKRLPARDLAIVFRSIASLSGAGVPLDQAVGSSALLARGKLCGVLAAAHRRLKEGESLAAALDGVEGGIPPVVLGMIRAGERGSRLTVALEQAAVHLEQEADLAGSLRQALAYPLLLLVTGATSIGVILTVVVPRFAELLADSGAPLPLATRTLLGASELGASGSAPILIGLLVVLLACFTWLRGADGGASLDRLLLRLPLIGPVRHSLATARVCRALGSTLESGMPALSAIDAAREAASDRAVSERAARARERVAGGEPLAASFEREGVVIALAAQLLAVGEGSGRLAVMAERAGTLSACEAERRLRTALSLLEPALIALFGGVVALVAIGLLQAVYSVRP